MGNINKASLVRLRQMKRLFIIILALLGWSNKLAKAADLANSEGAGGIVPEAGRGGALLFTLTDPAQSSSRTFTLPVERLRGRFVYVEAAVRAEAISAKPAPWNGIKVMLRIDTPPAPNGRNRRFRRVPLIGTGFPAASSFP